MEEELGLTRDQVAEFKEAFTLFDKDGDGSIDKDELATVMKSLGLEPTDREIKDIMTAADVDGNGTIDFDEFLRFMSEKMRSSAADAGEELKASFKEFDKDGNGLISPQELRSVFEHLGEKLTKEEIAALMTYADSSGDGFVSWEDFVRIAESGEPK